MDLCQNPLRKGFLRFNIVVVLYILNTWVYVKIGLERDFDFSNLRYQNPGPVMKEAKIRPKSAELLCEMMYFYSIVLTFNQGGHTKVSCK